MAYSGETEAERPVRVRLAQRFFRQSVLAAYEFRCCVTGIDQPQLLIASHILPWSGHPEHRAKLQIDVLDRSKDETAELAVKVFELSQVLKEKWLTANYATKRRLLEIVCLNSVLDGVTLVPEIRKPFDVLAEGLLISPSRDNCRSFEPWTPARDAFATAFLGQREPHLTELWAMSEDAA